MKLCALHVDGFKNLEQVDLTADPMYNLIVGGNAQGKTNLLESIWTLTGCRSFRGTQERDFLGFTRENLEITATTQTSRREETLSYRAVRTGEGVDRRCMHNGVVCKKQDLFAHFPCVVFTPDDTDLICGGPSTRRDFLNLCISQLDLSFLRVVRLYNLTLRQRNALLKQQAQPDAQLDVWDEKLAAYGAHILQKRVAYVEKFSAVFVPLYTKISGGRETPGIKYIATGLGKDAPRDLQAASEEELRGRLLQRLQDTRARDAEVGFTSSGPHRDDFLLTLNGRSARLYGSQGQKKSLAAALKLAQASLARHNLDEAPLILLDDVLGELDRNRQAVLLEQVEGLQIFMTTCQESAVHGLFSGAVFQMEEGHLTPYAGT